MPRLILRALERHVEADLDELVFLTQHCLAHSGYPRVGCELDESTKSLRMGFDIPSPRPTPHRAAGSLNRLPERRHHVFATSLHPLAGKRALQRGDAVAIQGRDVFRDFWRSDRIHGSRKMLPERVARQWRQEHECLASAPCPHGLLRKECNPPGQRCRLLYATTAGGVQGPQHDGWSRSIAAARATGDSGRPRASASPGASLGQLRRRLAMSDLPHLHFDPGTGL